MPLREGPRSHAAVKGRHTAADESRHCKGLGRRRQKCAAALMGISAAPSVKCNCGLVSAKAVHGLNDTLLVAARHARVERKPDQAL